MQLGKDLVVLTEDSQYFCGGGIKATLIMIYDFEKGIQAKMRI